MNTTAREVNLMDAAIQVEDTSSLFLIEGLQVCFGDKVACEIVSMKIPANKVTAIVGPSGSGKSTFLCCLNNMTGALEDCEISGEVCFNGTRCCDIESTNLRRRVGMVFQRPNPLPFSIWKNIDLPLKRNGLKSKIERETRIIDSLKRAELWVEVKDRLHQSAVTLSGGQQQRLCIARALALQPEVLLLDEPCSALDPVSTNRIEELIHKLKSDHTIIIVTHNIGQAKRVADHVAVFGNINNRGVLLEDGPAIEVFDNPKNELTTQFLAAGL